MRSCCSITGSFGNIQSHRIVSRAIRQYTELRGSKDQVSGKQLSTNEDKKVDNCFLMCYILDVAEENTKK